MATYSGMLPGLLAGQFEFDELSIDLDRLCSRAGAQLVIAKTTGLDLPNGLLLFADREPIYFDVLSIGVGSMPIGWQQHSSSPLVVAIKPMQTFAERLRAHLLARPSQPRIAIVGGGVASVEVALCVQRSPMEPTQQFALDIFTASPHVADGMTQRSVRSIERVLDRRDIAVHSQQSVTEVNTQALVTDGGRLHESDCVIWATGAAPPPVIASLGLQADARGFIATHATLQSLSDTCVFAVGDAGTVSEHPAPKAGVIAVRQGPILWHNIRALLTDRPLKSFQPQRDFLKILNTGDGRALLEYGCLTIHARWCWHLKTWIDKRFIAGMRI